MPHEPIILQQAGRGEESVVQKIIVSCREVSKRIAALKPDTIVITTPHSIVYADYFHISPGSSAKGDLLKYGVDSDKFNICVEYDCGFVSALQIEAAKYGIAAGTLNEKDARLDHGTIVPLSFIRELYTDFKLVRIGLSMLPFSDNYIFGECISKTADFLESNIILVASGDLSRKAPVENHFGFAAEGISFDKQIARAIQNGDFLKLLTLEETSKEETEVYELRSFLILAGALDGKRVKSQLLSCEEVSGFNCGVASFIPFEKNENRKFLDIYNKLEGFQLKNSKEIKDEYVALAKYSIESYIKTGKIANLPLNLPEEMLLRKAGVFVSIKKHGNLRGSIGTISPVTGNIAYEIQRNAVNAATNDPRFKPVNASELSDITCSVDVLSPPEQVSSIDFLDHERYGVIVKCGHKRGLLLPRIEKVKSTKQQIEIALSKADIRNDETFSIERFEVVRHKE